LRNDLIKILVGIFVGIFLTLSLRGCGRTSIDCGEIYKTKEDVKIVSHTDTVYVHHTDTVYVKGPVSYVGLDEPTDSYGNIMVHEYNEPDLEATITTNIVSGFQELEYVAICPVINNTDTITITNTDTVTITKDNFIEKSRMRFFLGTELAFSDKSIVGAGFNATVQFKNHYQVYYEYGIAFGGGSIPIEHRIGIKIPLTFGGRK